MNQQQAKQIAAEYLKSRMDIASLLPEILDHHTIVKPYGWIFFDQSKRHLETGSISDMLVGNGPILVKDSGEVVQFPTAIPLEESIRRYEAGLPLLPRPLPRS